jgi:serine/threonine protein kinase
MRAAVGDYPARSWASFAADADQRRLRNPRLLKPTSDGSAQERAGDVPAGTGGPSGGEAKAADDPLSAPVPRLISGDALDLLGRLLAVDDAQRPTAAQALQHAYFDPVRQRLSPATATAGAESAGAEGESEGQKKRTQRKG